MEKDKNKAIKLLRSFLKEKRRQAVERAYNWLKIGLYALVNVYDHMVKHNKTNFHTPES